MKTKITLLIAAICLVTTSCIKDYYGHGNDLKLTKENTVYEGYLYYNFLTNQIGALEQRKKELEAIINNQQGDSQTQAELDAVNENINENNEERDTIIDLRSLTGIEIGPVPPCPRGKCILPPEFNIFLFESRAALSQLIFLNDSQEQINKNGGLQSLNGQGLGKKMSYQEIELNNYVGPVTIIVERLNRFGKVITYTSDANIGVN